MERDAPAASSASDRLEPSLPLFWLVEEDEEILLRIVLALGGGSTTEIKFHRLSQLS